MATNQIEIYLNSNNAFLKINGESNNSDMIFFFNSPIQKRLGYDMHIALTNIVIPLSFTLVDDTNNELVVNGVSYTIPSANYSVSTLQEALSTLLTGFTISYDSGTMKYRFQSSSDFTFNEESTCFTLLGFTAGDHVSTANVLYSDSIINLSGINMIYFSIPSIAVNNIDSTTGSRSSIIKSIPISNASLGSVLVWQNQTSSHIRLQNDSISYFHVRIVGEDLQTALRLNHQSWNATLTISYQKNEDDISFSDTINRYVQGIPPTRPDINRP